MKNDDYWANRAKNERDWIDKNIKNDKDFDKVLEQHYNKLTDDIMDKINKEYISLGKNNGYTMADAMAKVKAIDVEKFGKTAKDLVDKAHELYKKNGNVGYYNFTDRTNKALRLYNATMRINRLEMLKAQIGEDVVQNGINVNSEINDKLKNDALDEFKRQAGILGKNRAKPDLKEITKIVSAQTGDVTFSDRIWQDQASLKAELDVLLTKQMVRGISPIEIARDLKKLVSSKVDSVRYATERIARTESARVQTQVQLASFDKYDINYCHWIAEPTACQMCTDISENNDGMGEGIYSTTEVPFLPAHPNCRCSLSAYEPDEAQLESKGKKPNKNILSNDDVKVLETPDTDIIASFNKTNIKEAFGEEKYRQFKNSISSLKDEQLRKLYANYGQDLEFENVSKTGGNYASTSTVHLSNSAFEGDKIHEPMETVYHEIGHAIDSTSMNDVFGKQLIPTGRQIKRRSYGRTYTFDEQASHLSGEPSVDLGKTIKQDLFDYINHGEAKSPMQMGKKPRKKAEKAIWLEEDSKSWEGVEKIRQFIRDTKPTALENMKKYSNTSDIIEGTGYDAFAYPWGVGHGSKYWNDYGKEETEFFAEYTSSRATNPASLALIKKIFPNAAKICDSLIDKMVEAKK